MTIKIFSLGIFNNYEQCSASGCYKRNWRLYTVSWKVHRDRGDWKRCTVILKIRSQIKLFCRTCTCHLHFCLLHCTLCDFIIRGTLNLYKPKLFSGYLKFFIRDILLKYFAFYHCNNFPKAKLSQQIILKHLKFYRRLNCIRKCKINRFFSFSKVSKYWFLIIIILQFDCFRV